MDSNQNQGCRICDVSMIDGDSVLLFSQCGDVIEFTYSGELYEELMQIPCMETMSYTFICSSCDLQMKLFKRLKEKAWRMMKKIKDFGAKAETQTNEDVRQNTEISSIEEHVENNEINEQFIYSEENQKDSHQEAIEVQNSDIIEERDYENIDNELIIYDDSPLDSPIIYYEVNDIEGVEEEIEGNQTEYTEAEDVSNNLLVANENIQISEEVVEIVETIKKDKPKRARLKSDETQCKDCFINFENIQLLKNHRQEKHGRTYLCKKCQKLFKTAENLESHMRIHLGLPAYSCDMCQRTFNQKVHYQNHLKRHSNVRDFVCNICTKGYYNKSDLTTHMRMHDNIKNFRCNYENCGKTFYKEQHLRYHLYVHTGDKNFECNLCQQKFVAPNALTTHIRTMHNEKQFECQECNKKFRRKHILELHLAVHSKNKTSEYIEYDNEYYDNISDMQINEEILVSAKNEQINDNEIRNSNDEEFLRV